MEKAIQKAINAGMSGSFDYLFNINRADLLLMPEFWRCLGVSLGWSEHPTCKSCERTDCDHVDGYETKWLVLWHGFIDHLSQGKNPEEFFNSLTK